MKRETFVHTMPARHLPAAISVRSARSAVSFSGVGSTVAASSSRGRWERRVFRDVERGEPRGVNPQRRIVEQVARAFEQRVPRRRLIAVEQQPAHAVARRLDRLLQQLQVAGHLPDLVDLLDQAGARPWAAAQDVPQP
jgi:hypothetical protein